MPKLIKKRSKKSGLPPESLIHIGEKHVEAVKITAMDYDEAHLQEEEIKSLDRCIPLKNRPTVTWVNVEGVHQVDVLEKLGKGDPAEDTCPEKGDDIS